MGDAEQEVIGQIYECALDASGWTGTLGMLADFCGGENVALAVIDQNTGYSAVTAPRSDPSVIAAYEQIWWRLDPTAPVTGVMAVGQITSLDTTGREHFLKSQFYNEFWKHSGFGAERLASNLAVRDGFFASAVLQTSPRYDRVDAQMERRFRLVVPHLVRSVELANRYRARQFDALLRGTAGVTGCLVVDADMHLVYANADGEAIIEQSRCFTLRRGVLGLASRAADMALESAVIATMSPHGQGWSGKARTSRVTMTCRKTSQTISIDIEPVSPLGSVPGLPLVPGSRAVAVLNVGYLVNRKRVALDELRYRFGLTVAEATLAYEMLAGDGRQAAAERCGISINTARTHLTRIFDKTGVKRQAELVALVNRLIPPN
ncbi:MAG: helix-turn-helix transcriptional regulator [Novosphingobium sp.]|nr:helix-turn-helix transcriptional regulator [Novosphingobium sp.]